MTRTCFGRLERAFAGSAAAVGALAWGCPWLTGDDHFGLTWTVAPTAEPYFAVLLSAIAFTVIFFAAGWRSVRILIFLCACAAIASGLKLYLYVSSKWWFSESVTNRLSWGGLVAAAGPIVAGLLLLRISAWGAKRPRVWSFVAITASVAILISAAAFEYHWNPPTLKEKLIEEPAISQTVAAEALRSVVEERQKTNRGGEVTVFLSIAERDPEPGLLSDFSSIVPVRPASLAGKGPTGRVWDTTADRPGLLVAVGRPRWTSPRSVRVGVAEYVGPLGAGWFLYSLQFGGGKWRVVEKKLTGVS